MTVGWCEETRLRIRLSVAAWAYEVHADPLMSDAEFDDLSLRVDLSKATSRPDMDEWFRQNFVPHSGVWVRSHPDQNGLETVYRTLTRRPACAWESIFDKLLTQHLVSSPKSRVAGK